MYCHLSKLLSTSFIASMYLLLSTCIYCPLFCLRSTCIYRLLGTFLLAADLFLPRLLWLPTCFTSGRGDGDGDGSMVMDWWWLRWRWCWIGWWWWLWCVVSMVIDCDGGLLVFTHWLTPNRHHSLLTLEHSLLLHSLNTPALMHSCIHSLIESSLMHSLTHSLLTNFLLSP